MPSINTTSKLVLAFVTLIIGVVLIGTIATEGLDKTVKDVAVDESDSWTTFYSNGSQINESIATFTVTNAPTSWKSNDCPLTSVTLTNASGTALTVTTDYTVTLSTGVVSILNTEETNITNFASGGTNNNSLITYTYCADNYLNVGWGRTMVNLIPGFFAIAILLVSIGLFYSVGKDYSLW